ncbi:Electron transport complex protein rnfE [Raoultella ornithinolytica]|nr:Electron transport complex protein rnfE [Raoultella ornithinolytica]
MSEVKDVIVQGLWKNNSALVQLLGMCPLLAVTSTATNALGLGLATTLVLTLTNLTISSLRRWTPAEIRIPIYVMIIASVVSVVQMLINAYAFGLYQSLGIFIPLIVNQLHRGRSCRSVRCQKRAGTVGAGWFLHWYGGDLRDVCARFAARNPRQRDAV